MRPALFVIALAALAVAAPGPAAARSKHPPQRNACADRPYQFSWLGFLTNPAPAPNGCAPPVYAFGKYIGQDPDPNIRHQLRRDPATGYGALSNP